MSFVLFVLPERTDTNRKMCVGNYIIYIYIYFLKSDNTNSKHQHRVKITELDEQGSEGELTAAYKDKN